MGQLVLALTWGDAAGYAALSGCIVLAYVIRLCCGRRGD
jgi:hypothetical protein